MKKRLTVAAVAAVAMLVAATSAFAAIDSYTAGFSFHGRPGSKSRPAALSYSEHFALKAVTPGALTGVLSEIKTTVSGMTMDVGTLPTCTAAAINQANDDTGCKKQALVASGSITAVLGLKSNYTSPQGPCDPALHVWNAGAHKLTFFFVTTAAHECLHGAIKTGASPAFTGSYRESGGKLVTTIPVPTDVTDPGNGGLLAALSSETLNWHSATVGGHHTIASTGCQGKRHFSYLFKAGLPTGQTETKTITGTAACG